MIREAIETLDPPGALLSEDAVLRKYGPEPIHEAQAIVDALTQILGRSTETEMNINSGQPWSEADLRSATRAPGLAALLCAMLLPSFHVHVDLWPGVHA